MNLRHSLHPEYNQDIPPVPTMSTPIDFSQHQRQRPRKGSYLNHPAGDNDQHPSISYRRPTLDRANSATPSITVQHHDMGTPDSVKIRRMKFEIEIESPSSRQRRARSASTSVGDSPSKLSSGKTSRREYPSTVHEGQTLMCRTSIFPCSSSATSLVLTFSGQLA